jgi:hypothetical protein
MTLTDDIERGWTEADVELPVAGPQTITKDHTDRCSRIKRYTCKRAINVNYLTLVQPMMVERTNATGFEALIGFRKRPAGRARARNCFGWRGGGRGRLTKATSAAGSSCSKRS